MLMPKLFVKLLINIKYQKQNFSKLQNCFLNSQCTINNKKRTYSKKSVTSNPFFPNHCEKYKESLKKCTKIQSSNCNNNSCTASQLQIMKTERNLADVYIHILNKVKNEALNVEVCTEESADSIIISMREEMFESEYNKKCQILQMLKEIEAKHDIILKMCIVSATQCRNGNQVLSDKFNKILQKGHFENEKCVKLIKHNLEEVQHYVKKRTDLALKVIHTCVGNISPYTLKHCIDKTEAEASCILESVAEYSQEAIENCNKLKLMVMKDNNGLVKNMTDFETEVLNFSKVVDDCIKNLKKRYK